MRRTGAALLLPTLAGLVLAGAVSPGARAYTATSGAAGCVTEREYVAVHAGMRKAQVHDLFGTYGRFGAGGAGGYSRVYARCGTSTGSVVVEYADGPGAPARVEDKTWRSVGVGDVRVLEGGRARNAFDIVNRPVRSDHIWSRGGDDYVFMQADGYRDVIRCGRGDDDLVHYLDHREARDVYYGCETVTTYSP